MSKFRILFAATVLACAAAPIASAQFYTSGSDAPGLDWQHFKTARYDIIYPAGMDSLAFEYARSLEKYSTGFDVPGLLGKRKVPVILRNRTAYSNGFVVLPPLRMELYTIADPYEPLPSPWIEQLAVHETRHVQQMLHTRKRPWNIVRIAAGGLIDGAHIGLWAERSLYEGDAVATETRNTASGRGRSADFLEYYRVSIAEGDRRNFYRWRYGSQKLYTPDYYRAGYLAVADMGEDVYFSGLPGKKYLRHFDNALDTYEAFWKENDSVRGPYTVAGRQLFKAPRLHTEYESMTITDDGMIAIEEGLSKARSLVHISHDGKITRIRPFSSYTSSLRSCPETRRIYWSEHNSDLRWEYKSFSDIRYLDEDGKVHTLTEGKRYFNPAPSEDGDVLAVCEYLEDGSTAVVLLDSDGGEMLESMKMPGGLQVLDCCWIDGELYLHVLCDKGFSICRAEGMEMLMEPANCKVADFFAHEDRIYFTSDANGVNELYSLNPENGEVMQHSSTPRGAVEFVFEGDSLYFTVLSTKGRLPHVAPVDSLRPKRADLGKTPVYPFTPEAAGDMASVRAAHERTEEFSMTAPEKYRVGLPRFHSWLPIYFDYDSIDNLSSFDVTSAMGIGATAFFQNVHGNLYGNAAVLLTNAGNGWRPAVELNLTTDAFFPVFETKLRVNARQAYDYALKVIEEEGVYYLALDGEPSDRPYVNWFVRSHLPLNFSHSGLSIGLVPTVSLNYTNDHLTPEYLGKAGRNMTMANIGVRGYVMESIPSSRVYPRLGIGAEIGHSGYIGMADVVNSRSYAMIYGYLPGLGQTQGLRISATGELVSGNGPMSINSTGSLPRGASAYTASLLSDYPLRMKLSLDYVIPFGAVDWSFLSPVAYIRNFELTPHFDMALLYNDKNMLPLGSVGAEFTVRLGNLLWLPFDTRVGVDVSYSNSPGMGNPESGPGLSCGFVMSVDI